MNTPQQLRDRGEVGKLRGIELAAAAKLERVAKGQIAMLRALFASPDGSATLVDATRDLSAGFEDGGKWRGSICRSLAMARIIEKVGVVQSDRPSRHRGYLARWRLRDRRKALLLLSRLVAAQDCRVGAASDMPDTSPVNKEPAPAPFAEELAGTGSVQQSFPQFGKKENENHG